MKATAIAHPNIAFTKYWGNKKGGRNIPENSSISMNLSNCWSKTTVEFSECEKEWIEDRITINGIPAGDSYKNKIRTCGEITGDFKYFVGLDTLRAITNKRFCAKVVSENNFPKGTGIASSASGVAALTLAAAKALGLELPEEELSRIARIGSGSSCRSIPSGFVMWDKGCNYEDSYAHSIAPPEHWDILDIVAIVSTEEKKISSNQGHELAATSPFYTTRIKNVERRNGRVHRAIKDKDFKTLGKVCEEDCLSMHAVMLTSKPSLRYWTGKTLELLNEIGEWRKEGIEAYFTVDAGPNVHIITLPEHENEIVYRLFNLPVKESIVNKPGGPARIINEHLF